MWELAKLKDLFKPSRELKKLLHHVHRLHLHNWEYITDDQWVKSITNKSALELYAHARRCKKCGKIEYRGRVYGLWIPSEKLSNKKN